VAARCHRLSDPNGKNQQKGSDVDIGRQRENASRIGRAAKIDKRDQQQDPEAERERVGVQRRNRGDQRADAGRDADCNIEHVVDHQRRSGEQAGVGAEVVLRDDIGAAVVRIGANGLPIRGEQDQQQHHDRRHDPADMGRACGPDRNEDCECRLGSVRRRPDPVEPHGGHTFECSDPPAAEFAIEQPAAEEKIEDTHVRARQGILKLAIRRKTRSPAEGLRARHEARKGPGHTREGTASRVTGLTAAESARRSSQADAKSAKLSIDDSAGISD
jgi:hypothetical protein